MTEIKKVLFLAAQSKEVKPASEFQAIEGIVSDELEIVNFPIGAFEDIIRGIQRKGTQIIHFCGHGIPRGSLIIELEGEDKGEGHEVKPHELAGAFEGVKDISCVVLNYCYSASAAELVAKHIDYVIGINGLIDREAAIAFSKSFYGALKDDKILDLNGFQNAVRAGQSALNLSGVKDALVFHENPKLLEVQLQEPKEESTVPMKSTFKGTYKNLPKDSNMWLYVFPLEDDKYYLTRIDDHKDGVWKRENVVIGREGEVDRGKKFRVGVLIADKEALKNDKYATLVELPSGVQQGKEYVIVRE
jgi:hypothetical protein